MAVDSNKSASKADALRNRFHAQKAEPIVTTLVAGEVKEEVEKEVKAADTVIAEEVKDDVKAAVIEANSTKTDNSPSVIKDSKPTTQQKRRGRPKGSASSTAKSGDGDKGKTFTIKLTNDSYDKILKRALEKSAETGELYSPQRLAIEVLTKEFKL